MRWPGYVSLKNRVVGLLSSQIGPLAAEFLDGVSGWNSDKTIQFLPRLASLLNAAVNEATPELIKACLVEPLPDLDELPAIDWMTLRDACAEVNDLGGLIEREKNSLRATFGSALNLFNGLRTSPAASGGRNGNPS